MAYIGSRNKSKKLGSVNCKRPGREINLLLDRLHYTADVNTYNATLMSSVKTAGTTMRIASARQGSEGMSMATINKLRVISWI